MFFSSAAQIFLRDTLFPVAEPHGSSELQISSIYPFSPLGESSQMAQKWLKWKKSFQYFVTASGVRDDGRRKALLLHLVGLQTQEVFETLRSCR